MRVLGTPLDFYENDSIDTVFMLITMAQSFFLHIQNFGVQKLPKIFVGRRFRFSLDFHKNQGIRAVFHADYDGEVRFSPHLKMAPLEPLAKAKI